MNLAYRLRAILLMTGAILLSTSLAAAFPPNEYPVHPDSEPQEGVPKGEIKGPFDWQSKIYPGTERQYWVYVPAQYNKEKPACTLILQDGLGRANGWKIPAVLDNLIHKGEVPVQVGIFISPGVVPTTDKQAQPRFNRSFEYDAMGDRYARFLLEEILPEVSKSYNLSTDPNDRCIGGASSGAICAFTAAWERPDQFRRVLSTIGTFVDLRGGGEYPTLIRKCEPKPIRVFLQDGSNDNNLYGGDWFNANQGMLSALKYSGYDVNHAWGEGGHDGKQSTAIMPDILKWLWRDYPAPIQPGVAPKRRTDLVIPGEEWQLVSEGHKFTEGPAVNDAGELFFTDIPNSRIHKVDAAGAVTVFAENTESANGLQFGPDGRLYACANGAEKIVAFDADGTKHDIVSGHESNDLLLLHDGNGYFTDPNNKKVHWFDWKTGENKEVDSGIEFPNGIICSPDQTLITVCDSRGRFTYAFQRDPKDNTLKFKQEYGHLHVPDNTHQSGADGMCVDTEGRIYVTTRLGVQIMDQLGRVHLILTKPGPGWLSNVTFGGENQSTLYVTCGERVFKRKIKATGVNPARPPIAPPKPGL